MRCGYSVPSPIPPRAPGARAETARSMESMPRAYHESLSTQRPLITKVSKPPQIAWPQIAWLRAYRGYWGVADKRKRLGDDQGLEVVGPSALLQSGSIGIDWDRSGSIGTSASAARPTGQAPHW